MVEVIMSLDWIVAKAADLGREPMVLVQGYEWTGLGYYRNGEIDFGRKLPFLWTEYWDVRVFGEKGEWHCWRSGDVWRARYAAVEDWKDHEVRDYVLKGREIQGKWVQESGGARYYYPMPLADDLKNRPLRLCAWLEVAEDSDTGLRYFRDAMLREIRQEPIGRR